MTGIHNLIFTVQYSWDDPDTGFTHQWIEIASVENMNVTPRFTFDWPDFLIPLLVGAAVSQIVTWWNNRSRYRREDEEREQQARGIVLAILQTAHEAIKRNEPVSFHLWEEAVVKGNFYPAIHQLGRRIGKPDLSARLAQLPAKLDEYNNRREDNHLTPEMQQTFMSEVSELIADIDMNRS
jgi:hypothetical protein